jgi:rhodanese-related sulfurtransferase
MAKPLAKIKHRGEKIMKSNKVLCVLLTSVMLVALLLSACAPAATPAPTTVPPTAAPTAAPTVAPKPVDFKPVMDKYLAGLPDGFGGVAPATLAKEIQDGKKSFLVDVREPKELTDNGFIEGAVNLPIRTLAQNLDKLPAKDQPIVVYCGVGHRGGIAMEALQLLGYTNVRSISGGFNAWKAANLAVVTGTPIAPTAGKAPDVDKDLLAALDKYLTSLPDGFGGVAPATLAKDIQDGKKPFLLDVREPKELTDNGYLEGAVNVPIRTLTQNLDKLPAKDQPIVVYCGVGHRGGVGMMALHLLGYTNVKSLSGGFNAWKAGNFPIVKQ